MPVPLPEAAGKRNATKVSKSIRSEQKTGHVPNFANSKKSTFLVQSSLKLVKMMASWGNYFHKVSWGLDKNCGFLTNG